MDALDLARWQFGITTVYHFLFVPLTHRPVGARRRSCRPRGSAPATSSTCRLTKFFGKLFLINFAMGVVTGIVQEFQFGMNWSDYSRFVGDIFGAPLAIEAPARLLPRVDLPRPVDLRLGPAAQEGPPRHASGSPRSAPCSRRYFILAANSWMQHPVGYRFNPEHRPRRADRLRRGAHQQRPRSSTFPHVITGRVPGRRRLRASASSAWHLVRARPVDVDASSQHRRRRLGAVTVLIAGGRVIAITGDVQAKIMIEQQPMKMAAAEALCETEPRRRVLALHRSARLDGRERLVAHRDPRPAVVPRHRRLQRPRSRASTTCRPQYEEQFGPGDYTPEHPGHLLELPRR